MLQLPVCLFGPKFSNNGYVLTTLSLILMIEMELLTSDCDFFNEIFREFKLVMDENLRLFLRKMQKKKNKKRKCHNVLRLKPNVAKDCTKN